MNYLSLEQIYNQPDIWINSLLTQNNQSTTNNNLTNRLIASILIYNANILNLEDRPLIQNPRFNELYQKTDSELLQIIKLRGTLPSLNMTHIELIKHILNPIPLNNSITPRSSVQIVQPTSVYTPPTQPPVTSQISPQPRGAVIDPQQQTYYRPTRNVDITALDNYRSYDWRPLIKYYLQNSQAVDPFMSVLSNYSFMNRLLLYVQMNQRGIPLGPVRSYGGWRSLGFKVNKGEKAMGVIIPHQRSIRERSNDDDRYVTWMNFSYKKTAFAASQTNYDGTGLPERPINVSLQRLVTDYQLSNNILNNVDINNDSSLQEFFNQLALQLLRAGNRQYTNIELMAYTISFMLLYGIGRYSLAPSSFDFIDSLTPEEARKIIGLTSSILNKFYIN